MRVSHWCLQVTVTNVLSLFCCKVNAGPLKLHSLCCIVSTTAGAVLSERLSGALVKQKGVPFPKATNQEGTVTLKRRLPQISVLECPPFEVGWKYHVITAFLKDKHKEKTVL